MTYFNALLTFENQSFREYILCCALLFLKMLLANLLTFASRLMRGCFDTVDEFHYYAHTFKFLPLPWIKEFHRREAKSGQALKIDDLLELSLLSARAGISGSRLYNALHSSANGTSGGKKHNRRNSGSVDMRPPPHNNTKGTKKQRQRAKAQAEDTKSSLNGAQQSPRVDRPETSDSPGGSARGTPRDSRDTSDERSNGVDSGGVDKSGDATKDDGGMSALFGHGNDDVPAALLRTTAAVQPSLLYASAHPIIARVSTARARDLEMTIPFVGLALLYVLCGLPAARSHFYAFTLARFVEFIAHLVVPRYRLSFGAAVVANLSLFSMTTQLLYSALTDQGY